MSCIVEVMRSMRGTLLQVLGEHWNSIHLKT